ncbi:prolyl-tRNA synthetase associated domain-containing protein [Myroides sp. M-43]|uniref:YbaK/EbsC family protein n=1 Tax=Myroides oncorhynchi TaxID=2893756 RepID=UPI001E406D5A|nr:YbaK/EbsC family protein [Myroides oncorhynchi]MCC9041171.1 prolyl-tRNA synthetase associated domain-containing protein [Myroides oncorhynchi]
MIQISEISTKRPTHYLSSLQEQTYTVLETLAILWQRVQTSEVITMEDCLHIDEKLQMKMVKTLFLCNRQKTTFYLYITLGNKAFNSKVFSDMLNISRVSFAPPESLYEKMKTKIGAATIFGLLEDSANDIQLIFDQQVLEMQFYGCSDGTTTNYLKLNMEDVITKLLPYLKRELISIKL